MARRFPARCVLAVVERMSSPSRFIVLFFVVQLAASGRLGAQRHVMTFGPVREIAANRSAQGLLADDFNGDGLTDLATYGGSVVTVYYQGTTPAPWQGVTVRLDRPIWRAVAARCNGDRIADIALLTEPPTELVVLLGRTKRGLVQGWRRPLTEAVSHLLVANLNNDRRPDLLLWGEKRLGVDVFTGSAGGGFRPADALFPEYSFSSLAVDDMNDDGVADVVAGDWVANELRVATGFGNLRFGEPSVVPLDYEPTFVTTAFLNHDAIKDIVVVSAPNRSCQVFLGDGFGGYAPSAPIPLGVPPSAITIADVNGDGAPDIGILSAAGRSLVVGLNDGDGTIAELVRFAAGRAPAGFAFLPHARTARTDAAILDTADHRIRIALNAAVTDSSVPTLGAYLAGLAPAGIVAGGPGKSHAEDVFVGNTNSRTVSYFPARPDGGLTGQMSFSTVTRPTALTQLWRSDTMAVLLAADPHDRTSSVVEIHTDDFSHRSYPLPLREESELVAIDAEPPAGDLRILALEHEPGRSRSSLIEFEQIAPSRFIERACTPALPWPVDACVAPRRAGRRQRDVCYARYNARTKSEEIFRMSGEKPRQFGTPALQFSVAVPESVGVLAWSADLNADGAEDLILAFQEPVNTLTWALSVKDSAFTAPQGRLNGVTIAALADLQVADVNGDRLADILFDNGLTRNMSYLPGTGNGAFGPKVRLVSTEGIGGFTFRRRKKDGQPQLLVTDQLQGVLRIIPLTQEEGE